MLRQAEANALAAGVAAATSWQLGDAAALPFPAASFDLVVSSGSLHHWSAPAAVLAEAERVTKPGGRCLIHDSKRLGSPAARLLAFVIGRTLPADFRRHYSQSIRSSYTAAEARHLLTEAGLGDWSVAESMMDLLLLRGTAAG
jgi:ubiquinone/menaquinone biosynthesis C-methylase UbiE